jgi:predicted PolB exonuclease-like 3'-5' exonuclease
MTFDKKPWDITCLDLMEVWKSTGFEAATFDEMTYALNVKSPKSEMDGTMVHSYYHTGRIDEIKRYCESDVRALVDAATVLQDLAV